jgi:RNA polymerase-binding transcription factor DksA
MTREEIDEIFNTKFSEIIEKLKLKIMKRFYLFEYCDALDIIKKKDELLSGENINQSQFTPFRLMSAASRFGIGLNSLIEYLKTKNVDAKFLNAQSRLTEEVLLLIKMKFQKDVNTERQQNSYNYDRYNDKDLLEFKIHIQKKIYEAKKELKSLEEEINKKDIVRDTVFINKNFEISKNNRNFGKEHLRNIAKRQSDFIQKLDEALSRIENKTYGICRITGKLIDKKRLLALPHTTLCLEAKKGN